MFQVHIVGGSGTSLMKTIDPRVLFAQLVYRTGNIGGAEFSASTLASDNETDEGAPCPKLDDPVLDALTNAVASNSSRSTSSPTPSGAANEAEDSNSTPYGAVAPYPYFQTSFFQMDALRRRPEGGNLHYDVVLCTDAAAFDVVTEWLTQQVVAEAVHSGDGSGQQKSTVVAHVSCEHATRLPMLYSYLTSALVHMGVDGRSGWTKGVDCMVQKFQTMRNCELLYAIV